MLTLQEKLVVAKNYIDKLETELAEAEDRVFDYENKEASVCPEDVGFVEFIGLMEKRIKVLENELSRREAEAKARQAVLIAQLDTHVKLVLGMQSELAEARAGCAALLEKAEAACEEILNSRDPEDAKGIAAANLCAMGVEALIPTDAAAALAEEKRKARLEMRDRCAVEAYKAYKAGNGEMQAVASAASNNIRALGLEPREKAVVERVASAFDLIGHANSVTILSLGEMEAVVMRALNGEFDAELRAEKGANND